MVDISWPPITTPVLCMAFTRSEITAVRHAVAQHATDVGLSGDQLHDFVLAVNEIVTNAVIGGAGRGELRLWIKGRTVGCEITGKVTETNPGNITSGQVTSEARGWPAGFDSPGQELACRLVDRLDVSGSPHGTAIRLVTTLPTTD